MVFSLRQFPDREALSRAAARLVARYAADVISTRGRLTVALSGGNTPRRLYELLAAPPFSDQMPWDKIQFFWSDERPVPPDHTDSNYCLVYETLLQKAPVGPAQIHRMPAEREDLVQAAEYYQRELARIFAVNPFGEPPMLDLVLLGLGADGHTASLFPGTAALAEQRRWVVANYVPQLQSKRMTLTVPILNRAACVLFLVVGSDKSRALADVLQKRRNPTRFPAQLIVPTRGQVNWLVDAAAASALRREHEKANTWNDSVQHDHD